MQYHKQFEAPVLLYTLFILRTNVSCCSHDAPRQRRSTVGRQAMSLMTLR